MTRGRSVNRPLGRRVLESLPMNERQQSHIDYTETRILERPQASLLNRPAAGRTGRRRGAPADDGGGGY